MGNERVLTGALDRDLVDYAQLRRGRSIAILLRKRGPRRRGRRVRRPLGVEIIAPVGRLFIRAAGERRRLSGRLKMSENEIAERVADVGLALVRLVDSWKERRSFNAFERGDNVVREKVRAYFELSRERARRIEAAVRSRKRICKGRGRNKKTSNAAGAFDVFNPLTKRGKVKGLYALYPVRSGRSFNPLTKRGKVKGTRSS